MNVWWIGFACFLDQTLRILFWGHSYITYFHVANFSRDVFFITVVAKVAFNHGILCMNLFMNLVKMQLHKSKSAPLSQNISSHPLIKEFGPIVNLAASANRLYDLVQWHI